MTYANDDSVNPAAFKASLREEIPQGSKVEIDSRKVAPGDVFVALPGEKTDGHHFVGEALSRGASFAIVSKKEKELLSSMSFSMRKKCLEVSDPLEALQGWAKSVHAKRDVQVVAITGSLGKSTTKEFTKTLLEGSFSVYATPGNYNSQIGLPLTILNAPKQFSVGVFEMGMTQKGHIENLVSIAPPDIALITTIAPVHIEFFPDLLPGIWRAKKEIFSHPNTKVSIVHEDLLRYEKNTCYQTFSHKGCPFVLPFLEEQFIWDFMAARKIAHVLGIADETIQTRLHLLQTLPMRFQKKELQQITWINDAWNSSIDSLRYALLHLPEPKTVSFTKKGKTVQRKGEVIALLGPIVDLGEQSQKVHQEVGMLAAKYADQLLSFGEEGRDIVAGFRKGGKPAKHMPSKRAFFLESLNRAKPGDVVLVKASRKYGLEELFSFLS